ncbi:molybdate transport system permease protein [Micromonospora pisi]|uniref:Molybdenum transport system permease n=1 Tax=Micromonospora pisi TaxID=589240 RepID=A0A495JGY0_9ACTN|nr:molybdate ABC transporter permease subunit [Micromonospora pisi]RKR88290.1 molybdate transport system permease protein [Micromonospora pisi]
MDWQAVLLSLRLAATTTGILLVVALPLGAWLAYAPRRWWRTAIEAVVALPLVLPPSVLGFYALIALGPKSPVGRWYEDLTGSLLPFSFTGLLVGSVLFSLPFAVQPITAGFAGVDRRLLEASWSLGEFRTVTLARIAVPLALPGIVTGAVLSFAHTVGEFGVVLMLGGNLPGQTRTISIAIYDSVQAMDYATAGRTSLLLLVFSFAVLATTYTLQRRFTYAGATP